MTKRNLSFLLFLFAVSVAFSNEAPAQTKAAPARLTCERGEKLLRDEKKAVVTLDHNRLKEIAVEKVTPKFPRSCRCLGVIKVSILIDAKGRVKCVNTSGGNPLLRASAMQAAKKWTFNPVMADGKAVSARGELVFDFSSDGEVTY